MFIFFKDWFNLHTWHLWFCVTYTVITETYGLCVGDTPQAKLNKLYVLLTGFFTSSFSYGPWPSLPLPLLTRPQALPHPPHQAPGPPSPSSPSPRPSLTLLTRPQALPHPPHQAPGPPISQGHILTPIISSSSSTPLGPHAPNHIKMHVSNA